MKITETTKTLIELDLSDIKKGLQMILQAQGFKDFDIEKFSFIIMNHELMGGTISIEKSSTIDPNKIKNVQ
jgi:hypothetical protein